MHCGWGRQMDTKAPMISGASGFLFGALPCFSACVAKGTGQPVPHSLLPGALRRSYPPSSQQKAQVLGGIWVLGTNCTRWPLQQGPLRATQLGIRASLPALWSEGEWTQY